MMMPSTTRTCAMNDARQLIALVIRPPINGPAAAPSPAAALTMPNALARDWTWPTLFIHFPSYYQVARGGRMHFSFVQFFNSPVRYRPGANWEDGVLAEWDEWNPQRFSYPRHGRYFRYFLVRGGPENLVSAFGPYLQGLRVRSAGGWFLVERPPG